MKIRNLKNYGIPSYIVSIWEKHYSPCLLPLQEEAVRNYGILNCGISEIQEQENKKEGEMDSHFRGNDKKEGASRNHPHPALSPQGRVNGDNNNLLVIAPPSSGKSFLGEMATMAHLIH